MNMYVMYKAVSIQHSSVFVDMDYLGKNGANPPPLIWRGKKAGLFSQNCLEHFKRRISKLEPAEGRLLAAAAAGLRPPGLRSRDRPHRLVRCHRFFSPSGNTLCYSRILPHTLILSCTLLYCLRLSCTLFYSLTLSYTV